MISSIEVGWPRFPFTLSKSYYRMSKTHLFSGSTYFGSFYTLRVYAYPDLSLMQRMVAQYYGVLDDSRMCIRYTGPTSSTPTPHT